MFTSTPLPAPEITENTLIQQLVQIQHYIKDLEDDICSPFFARHVAIVDQEFNNFNKSLRQYRCNILNLKDEELRKAKSEKAADFADFKLRLIIRCEDCKSKRNKALAERSKLYLKNRDNIKMAGKILSHFASKYKQKRIADVTVKSIITFETETEILDYYYQVERFRVLLHPVALNVPGVVQLDPALASLFEKDPEFDAFAKVVIQSCK
jgi:hypothetical protein